MTDEQKGYLQALSDLRSWHHWQIGQALGDMHAMHATRALLRREADGLNSFIAGQ